MFAWLITSIYFFIETLRHTVGFPLTGQIIFILDNFLLILFFFIILSLLA